MTYDEEQCSELAGMLRLHLTEAECLGRYKGSRFAEGYIYRLSLHVAHMALQAHPELGATGPAAVVEAYVTRPGA